jgi:hypothetical protein
MRILLLLCFILMLNSAAQAQDARTQLFRTCMALRAGYFIPPTPQYCTCWAGAMLRLLPAGDLAAVMRGDLPWGAQHAVVYIDQRCTR